MLMSLPLLDLALRAATIAMLLVLAATLFRDYRHVVAGRLAVAVALGSVAHVLTYAIGGPAPATAWQAPIIALSTGNIVVFWLFTWAMFDDSFVLRWSHAAIWFAVAAISLVNCAVLASSDGNGGRLAVIAINVLVLGFIALAVAQTVSSWSSDLVEERRRVRVFIVAAAALYGGLNAILHLAIPGGDLAAVANAANGALLACVVAAICVAMLRVGGAELFAAAPAASEPVAPDMSAADQKLINALMRLMADERIYRHDNVSVGSLAAKLSIPEYRLRRLINQKLGYRNFNVFLNNHRIEEAKAALADPSQAEVPVITIAMDAGFASLGPFNRAFKAMTGLTPSEYRRRRGIAA
jgi:AraC-like DNA-binding protein